MLFQTVLWCGVIGLLIYLLKKVQGSWTIHTYNCMKDVPGPKLVPVVGNAFQFFLDPEELFKKGREFAKTYKNIYRLWFFNAVTINIVNPFDAEIVLSNPNFNTKSWIYTFLHPWLGTGLLTSKGTKWHERRKILTPAFHFSILQQFPPVIAEHSYKTITKLKMDCDQPYINIIPLITEFTLHTLCETTMGLKINKNINTITEYRHSIRRYGHLLLHRLFRPWLYRNLIFYLSPTGVAAKKVEESLHKFTKDVIDERLENWNDSSIENDENQYGKKRLAMLDLLITQMKNGENINNDGIREEVDTFMFEGHDTTTMGLCFALLAIANNKTVQENIVSELQNIFQGSDRLPTYQDIQKMNYLERCIKESLRLHPPVPFISREATEDLKLSTCTVPKGCLMHIHIYDIHRNSQYWSDPDKFDPDRFLPDKNATRHPFLHIPFSAGSRNCIGQKFAMMEEKIFISTILRHFVLEAIDKPDLVPIIPDLVLRPKGAIKIKFKKRLN